MRRAEHACYSAFRWNQVIIQRSQSKIICWLSRWLCQPCAFSSEADRSWQFVFVRGKRGAGGGGGRFGEGFLDSRLNEKEIDVAVVHQLVLFLSFFLVFLFFLAWKGIKWRNLLLFHRQKQESICVTVRILIGCVKSFGSLPVILTRGERDSRHKTSGGNPPGPVCVRRITGKADWRCINPIDLFGFRSGKPNFGSKKVSLSKCSSERFRSRNSSVVY